MTEAGRWSCRARPFRFATPMTVHSPLVSVGVPTYNRAKTLRRTLESLLAQSHSNLEIIISDNASTDATRAMCEEFCQRDARIRYVRQPLNRGPTENFKAVLRQARGEYYMWVADDDWLDSAYVAECVSLLATHPGYAMVCGQARYYDGDEFVLEGESTNLLEESGPARVLDYYRQVDLNGTFYGVARREQLCQIDFQHVLGGDWLYLAALAFVGRIRTVGHVSVNRSRDGMSRDLERLALSFDVNWKWAKQPFALIALLAFKDIAWRSPVYVPLGQFQRFRLASRVVAILARRFGPRSWSLLRRQLEGLLPRR